MKTVEQVRPIEAFDDNYIWAITQGSNKQVVIVDPGDAAPVIAFMQRHQLQLEAILITHHHFDHVGGVAQLLAHSGKHLPVYGPYGDAQDVVTHPLGQGDTVALNSVGVALNVLEVPGHTLDHISYYTDNSLFCGDTLFSAGCGRMFEGTPAQFHRSLSKLAALPADTKVYCAHEYTMANLAFAKAVSPQSQVLAQHIAKISMLRKQGIPSIPSTIAIELATNPFLRVNQLQIQQAIATQSRQPIENDPVEQFAALRRWKDGF